MSENPIPLRLKQARKNIGISQKDLGIKIGMDASSASGRMNHYEKGRHSPDLETLRKIAQELNVPLNYFLCEDDLSAELACLISRLDDTTKKALITELEKLESLDLENIVEQRKESSEMDMDIKDL
ncbi:helix-turn-helix transcriptional regulator [Marinomonas rhizomae]|uniref:helix-turn-helix domain-containing protein n=1 Tax=Marinomonas rhizomae TaxID=491948 RepID=UPI0021020732|nr:helix-turn-helix transcriptional regulator [Marinomonas rhizomae]UTV97947.1 helix-turn-helix transcriptional regulator [Marinomonas rhizomae]